MRSPPWRASHRARWWWIGCWRTRRGELTGDLAHQVGPVKGPLAFFVADHLVNCQETSIGKLSAIESVCQTRLLFCLSTSLAFNVYSKSLKKVGILATPTVSTFAQGMRTDTAEIQLFSTRRITQTAASISTDKTQLHFSPLVLPKVALLENRQRKGKWSYLKVDRLPY